MSKSYFGFHVLKARRRYLCQNCCLDTTWKLCRVTVLGLNLPKGFSWKISFLGVMFDIGSTWTWSLPWLFIRPRILTFPPPTTLTPSPPLCKNISANTCARDLKLYIHLKGVNWHIFRRNFFWVQIELLQVINGLT